MTVIEKPRAATPEASPAAAKGSGIGSAYYQKQLLKRSPVVKDVVTAKVKRTQRLAPPPVASQQQQQQNQLAAPLTIIIPNISQKALVAPSSASTLPAAAVAAAPPPTPHDYENLALININRSVIVYNDQEQR